MVVQASIVETEPTSEYQGTIYSQRVVVKLSDGTKIGLFDPDVAVSSEMVGSTRQLELSLLVEDVERVTETELGVVPVDENPTQWNGHTYNGKITSVASDGEYATIDLDFGLGSVEFDCDANLTADLSAGHSIRVTAQRSDIKALVEEDD